MARNIFNSIKLMKPKRNVFDLSHDVKLTMNMGWLVPVMNLECVPGDKFNLGCESLIRFAPLIAPVMHRIDARIEYFFCPYRLIWPNWETYMSPKTVSTVQPQRPFLRLTPADTTNGKLADYMGIPLVESGKTVDVNAFMFAAYQKIWNEYYRDQNLMAETASQLVDGLNSTNQSSLLTLRQRCWEHDYFTAALPYAQKGDAVELPLANVQIPNMQVVRDYTTGSTSMNATPGPVPITNIPTSDTSILESTLYTQSNSVPVGSTLVNDLRRAFRLQEWLEKNARGGTRYVENILSHFGVKTSDARLNRPEYIVGVKSPVVVSEVLSTFENTTEQVPQGNMSGHGISVVGGKHGSYYCEEHGCIIGLMSVLPKTAYQQGLHRMWRKEDPLDYYWPSFANLGEQAIFNIEVDVNHATPTGTFGYIPRYSEYKFMNNRVAGEFRDTLDFWHMGRYFTTDPALNEAFVKADPTTRIFAIDTVDAHNLYVHVLNKVKAVRPMPVFGTPTI